MNSTRRLRPERDLKKPYYLKRSVLKRLIPGRLEKIRDWAEKMAESEPRFAKMAKKDPLTLLVAYRQVTRTSPTNNVRQYIADTEKEFQHASGIEIKLCFVPGRKGVQVLITGGLFVPSISYGHLEKYCGNVLTR